MSKPRGKMSAYACFVQTCHEEQRYKNPKGKIAFPEVSKWCAGKWKVVSKHFERFTGQLFSSSINFFCSS